MERKQAKSSIAYGVLVIFLVIGIIALANLVIAFGQGNQDTSITYRAIENGNSIAGRQYTPFCLTDCHLPVCFSYDGNSLPAELNLGNQDLSHSLIYSQGVDQSVLKEMGIDYLTTETYSLDVADYGTCTGQVLNNETGKYDNYSYSCVTGSHQEQRTREVWKPYKDISQLQLEKGKEFCFDIWGKLAIKQNSKFAVDVIPVVRLQNNQFSFNELAWWNNSVTYRRNHTGNYSFNETSGTTNLPCLINSANGFNDSNVFNYIWGKCDTNLIRIYYNNASDFYLVNDSDNTQLPMDTENKNGNYDYNPNSTWDNFSIVILPNEDANTNIANINSSGQLGMGINFTGNCTGGDTGLEAIADLGTVNITSGGYVRTAINVTKTGSGCKIMRVHASQLSVTTSYTFEMVFRPEGFPSGTGEAQVFKFIDSGGATKRLEYNGSGDFYYVDTAVPSSPTCTWNANFVQGNWTYISLIVDRLDNVSFFLGYANGTHYSFTCSSVQFGGLSVNSGKTVVIGGDAETNYGLNATIDMVAFSNVTRSMGWVEARYRNILLNYSSFGNEQNSSGSSSVGITFIIRSAEDNSTVDNLNINCSNSFSQTGINSTYSTDFSPGDHFCTFRRSLYFNETVNFTAESNKTVNVYMSKIGGLTVEEHGWLESQNSLLEALYNCVIGSSDCILKEINDTVTDVWKYVTKTNRAVVTQEQFLNRTLNNSNNSAIVINYTINIPYKPGYSNGELLPLRLYFWFTDENKTLCYNQDKRSGAQNRAETPYCFPLVAETLGPNNGSVTFNVTLRPNLTAGNYNITRGIEIDPIIDGLQTWINYGVEDIGQITVEEGALVPDINLATGEKTAPIISETVIQSDLSERKETTTGNVMSDTKTLLSGTDILALARTLAVVFIISLIIVCLTMYKMRKLKYSA